MKLNRDHKRKRIANLTEISVYGRKSESNSQIDSSTIFRVISQSHDRIRFIKHAMLLIII